MQNDLVHVSKMEPVEQVEEEDEGATLDAPSGLFLRASKEIIQVIQKECSRSPPISMGEFVPCRFLSNHNNMNANDDDENDDENDDDEAEDENDPLIMDAYANEGTTFVYSTNNGNKNTWQEIESNRKAGAMTPTTSTLTEKGTKTRWVNQKKAGKATRGAVAAASVKKKNSVTGSIVTLLNTILGSGTLAVPYAIASSGWLLGMLIMTAIALVTQYSVHLLLIASDLAGSKCAKTYESLGHYTMGRWGTYLAEFTFIFGGFGTLVSYIIFISHLFSDLTGYSKEFVAILATCFVIAPLSLQRSIGRLQFTSLLATCSVAYVVLLIAYTCVLLKTNTEMFIHTTKSNKDDNVPFDFNATKVAEVAELAAAAGTAGTAAGSATGTNLFSPRIFAMRLDGASIYTVTLLVAAFACHNTALPVYEELKHRSLPRMNRAVSIAVSIAYIFYSIIGICGYFCFGADTQDNILLNFTQQKSRLDTREGKIQFILTKTMLTNNYNYTYMSSSSNSNSNSSSSPFHATTLEVHDKTLLLTLFPALHYPLILAQTLMGLALLLTCPIALWPFRSCLLSVYLRLVHGRQLPSSFASRTEFIALTLSSLAILLIAALFVPSVKIPLSIVGSVSGALIIFILPALFYLRLQPHPVLSLRDNLGPLCMLVTGFFLAIGGFTLTLTKIFATDKE